MLETCTACGNPKTFHAANGGPCVAEKTLGTECWCQTYETDFAAGIEAALKYGDPAGLFTGANAAFERGDHLGAEKLLDGYIRKTPQSERDDAWVSATERSIARSKAQKTGIHVSPVSLSQSITREAIKQQERPTVNAFDEGDQDSAIQLLFEKDEGPGAVGVKWFHTKEYLRDLGQDDLVPTTEKQSLRDYYTQQENVLRAKLAFFERKENVEKLTRLSWTQDLEVLAKAQIELRAATSHLSRLCRDSKARDALETAARKWRLTRKWDAITPNELKAAVEAIRHTVEHHGFWPSKWSTENLCYAALHPTDSSLKDSKRLEDLTSYRRFLIALLGPQIEGKLLNSDQPVAAIFKAYRDVLEVALKLLTRRGFQLMLNVAKANSTLLNVHPIDWTKRQFEILISAERSGIRSWIMDVCDPRILSVTASTDDSIFGGKWRAPRLIYMNPAGNVPYHAVAAWSREGLVKSQELLQALADNVMTLLRIELDEIAGDAHVRFAMRNSRGARVQQNGPEVEQFATESVMPIVAAANLEPNFWRTLHQSFKALSDEELAFLTRYPADRMLRAYGDYEDKKNCGHWSLSEGISEGLRGRFEVEATRAGLGLMPMSGEEPMAVWLHSVFQNLLANKSKLLFSSSKEGGIILQVAEASALYCARLEKQALLKQRGRNTPPPPLAEAQPIPNPSTETDSSPAERPTYQDRSQLELQKIREIAIKKVQNPPNFRTLKINEAAIYFEVASKTIHRWVSNGNLRSGGRRGTITTESVRQWEKRRSRKRRLKS